MTWKNSVFERDSNPQPLQPLEFILELCLVPRPRYYASVIRFGSRGPGEKCGLDKNPKSETICLTFSPSRCRLAGGNPLSVSWRRAARDKRFKLLTLGLMLIGQVKWLIWIQTDINRGRSIAAFKLLVYRQILITQKFLLHVNRSA